MSLFRGIEQRDPTARRRALIWAEIWALGVLLTFKIIKDDVSGRNPVATSDYRWYDRGSYSSYAPVYEPAQWESSDTGILVLGALLLVIPVFICWLLGHLRRTNLPAFYGLLGMISAVLTYTNHRTKQSLAWQAYARQQNAPQYRNPSDVEPPLSQGRPPWV